MAPASPARDVGAVSLLLGLPEEVFVHLVSLAGFTLTDIGHLRATCASLRRLLDRFRRVAKERAAGDLSRYRPYHHWDIQRAARNGHLELIEMLHADEIRHGRVSHCTDAVDGGAGFDGPPYGSCDVCVWMARNRAHDVTPSWKDAVVGARRGEHDDLDKEVSATCLYHWVDVEGAYSRGEMDRIVRLLPLLHDSHLLEELAAWCCRLSPRTLEAFVGECRRRNLGNVADDVIVCEAANADDADFAALLDLAVANGARMVPNRPPADTTTSESSSAAPSAAFSPNLIARLRALAAERRHGALDNVAAARSREDIIPLLLRGEYEAAREAVNAARMTNDGLRLVVDRLIHRRAAAALRWILAARISKCDAKYVCRAGLRGEYAPSAEFVDFAWPFAADFLPADEADDIARDWFCRAMSAGDAALLHHLCSCLDVVGILSRVRVADAIKSAARVGHSAVVSYMIDVNARASTVLDSAAARLPGAFDAQQRPFDLTSALDEAVRGGHVGLARMIDRRVPGLRASLSAACLSRRWELFRFVLGHLSPSERDEECGRAVVAAMCEGRFEFVRWFEENEPGVFERSVAAVGPKVLESVDGLLLCDILASFPRIRAGFQCTDATTYDMYALEAHLGIRLVRRPLNMRTLCLANSRAALQAAIDFRIPIARATSRFIDSFAREKNPALGRWLQERLLLGAFVLA